MVLELSDYVIGAVLLIIAVIDARRFEIPDRLSFTVIGLAAIQLYFIERDLSMDRLMGGVTAFLLFELTRRIMAFRLKRDALGMGDVKLMMGGGLWVGLSYLPFSILLACLTGLLHFLYLAVFYKTSLREQKIPFGPYLVLGLTSVKLPFIQNILSTLAPF